MAYAPAWPPINFRGGQNPPPMGATPGTIPMGGMFGNASAANGIAGAQGAAPASAMGGSGGMASLMLPPNLMAQPDGMGAPGINISAPSIGIDGATPDKPSFFGQGGVGRGIAGAIGDALLQSQHMQPIYAPQMQDRHRMQQQAAMMQQRRTDENSDWMARQQWELEHPKPINNDTVNDFNFIAQQLGPDAAKQYLGTMAAGPPMAVDAIDPTTHQTVRQYLPRSALPGMSAPAATGPAPGTVDGGYRFKGGDAKNPSNWEQVGGAPSRGGATFR